MGRETKTKTLDPSDPADLDEMRSDAEGEEFFRSLQSPERQRAGLELLASHVRRLVAEVARLAAERDAIVAAMDDPDHALAGVRRIIGPSPRAMAVVRRAAGLEEEAPR